MYSYRRLHGLEMFRVYFIPVIHSYNQDVQLTWKVHRLRSFTSVLLMHDSYRKSGKFYVVWVAWLI